MQIRIKGEEPTYTLLTIVSETVETNPTSSGTFFKDSSVIAYAYVYGKDFLVKRFPASEIEKVER